MADLKISQLNSIVTVVPATDVLPVVQGGTTLKITPKQILESGSPAVLASATITGDLTVDTNVLKVDTTNNRVGIGTASPVASFQATLSGLYGLCIQSADTNNSALNIGNDPTSGYAFIDATKSGSGSFLPLRLSTSDNERLRIETAGDVKIVTGNVVIATSGKGIDFGATSSPSAPSVMTSELLNDYEEGTFVPALSTDDVPFTSVTYVQQDGHYTKVGRLVTFCGTIYTSGVVKGAANGVVTITGLPFQQVAGLNGVLCYAAAFWASDSPVCGVVDNYRILLLKRPTTLGVATGTQTLTVAEVATGGTSNFLRFSGQYYV